MPGCRSPLSWRDIEAISIHRMEGGKIAETWQVWDTLSFLQQLGVG